MRDPMLTSPAVGWLWEAGRLGAASLLALLLFGTGWSRALPSALQAAVGPSRSSLRPFTASEPFSVFLPSVDKTSLSALSPSSGGVVASDGFAYVGYGESVAVIDVSDPTAPTLVQRLGPVAEMCEVLDLAEDGDRIYALCRDRRARLDHPGPRGAVAVISAASQDERAALEGTVLFDPEPWGLAARNGWVYVSFRDRVPPWRFADVTLGVLVIDARDGLRPTNAGTVETRTLTQDMVVHDRALLAAGAVWSEPYSDGPDALGVSVLDLTDPAAPRLAARALYEPPEGPFGNFWCSSIALQGSVALIASWDTLTTLHALDVSLPEAPEWLGHLHLAEGALAVTVSSDHPVVLATSDVAGRAEIVVLAPIASAEPGSPPTTPGIVGRVELPHEPAACYDIMAADGGLVFVVDAYAQDLYVVDVTEPAAPRLAGRLGRDVRTVQAP